MDSIKFLKPFLNRDVNFLEIGAGDCSLSFEVAKQVKMVTAIDVTEYITNFKSQPRNFKLIISDGIIIDVPPNTINVVYSNNLIEHIHPDDIMIHLRNIYQVLTSGGIFFCITPNRLTGPHDISQYFTKVATGFHLIEYTYTDLYNIFKSVGFSKLYSPIGYKCLSLKVPPRSLISLEKIISFIPRNVRIKMRILLDILLHIRIIATK